jgi:hypothetical protein
MTDLGCHPKQSAEKAEFWMKKNLAGARSQEASARGFDPPYHLQSLRPHGEIRVRLMNRSTAGSFARTAAHDSSSRSTYM